MKTFRAVSAAVAIVGALALAGCSAPATNSSKETPVAEASVVATPTPSPKPTTAAPTIESTATKLGIADFARSSDPVPLAIAWGQGTLNGSIVKIYQFADDTSWTLFLQSIAGYGVTEAQMVKVGLIAIAPNDQSQLDSIRAAAG